MIHVKSYETKDTQQNCVPNRHLAFICRQIWVVIILMLVRSVVCTIVKPVKFI